MECAFLGINTYKCILKRRCEGIYRLVLELGGDKKFAKNYSRYVWIRSTLHILRDKVRDPSRSKNTIKKLILTFILKIFNSINKNTYGLEQKLQKIEAEIIELENEQINLDPRVYFDKVGEGYSLMLHGAAIGSRAKRIKREQIRQLGIYMGSLVALKDSISDLEDDRKTGSYNPFKNWKNKDIQEFYLEYGGNLINKIKNNVFYIHKPVNFGNNGILRKRSATMSIANFAVASISCGPCSNACSDCQTSPAAGQFQTLALIGAGIFFAACFIPLCFSSRYRHCFADNCGGSNCNCT